MSFGENSLSDGSIAARGAARLVLCAGAALFSPAAAAVDWACDRGYVWREAVLNDYVCVTPEVREQARKDNEAATSRWAPGKLGTDACIPGFVWREAFAGDTTCVTTWGRDIARYENEQAARRRSPTGGPDGLDTCLPGFVWRGASLTDVVCVDPAARQRVRDENTNAANAKGSRACMPGYVWREASPHDYVCVEPKVREQVRIDNLAHDTRERTLGGACDSYATEAVAQYKEMMARECGLSGAGWQGDPNPHRAWCRKAARADRDGESAARREALRECAVRSVETERPAWEQCLVSVVIASRTCIAGDGSPAGNMPPESSLPGCGSNVENARLRAKINFGGGFCLSEGDNPERGCCTYEEQIIPGCLCQ